MDLQGLARTCFLELSSPLTYLFYQLRTSWMSSGVCRLMFQTSISCLIQDHRCSWFMTDGYEWRNANPEIWDHSHQSCSILPEIRTWLWPNFFEICARVKAKKQIETASHCISIHYILVIELLRPFPTRKLWTQLHLRACLVWNKCQALFIVGKSLNLREAGFLVYRKSCLHI